MPEFLVIHKDIAGVEIGECAPLNLRFGWSLDQPGYIQYDMPTTDKLATQLRTRPYRTDFQLRDRSGQYYIGGYHTELSMQEHQYGRMLSIAGKDYLHVLDRNMWPRDPNSNYRTSVTSDSTNGTTFHMVDETISAMVVQLIYQGQNDSAFAAISPAEDSYTIQFTGGFPSPGVGTFSYHIDPGDTRSLRSHIDEMLSLNTSTSTYYLRLDPNNQFPLDATTGELPKYGTSTPVSYKFNASPNGGNCEVVGWRHGGIRGTRFFGVAQGPSSKKGEFLEGSGTLYRRWDYSEEFSGPSAVNDLSDLVSATYADGLIPDFEMQIRVYDDPQRFSPWFREVLWPGCRVQLTANLFWADIVDTFTITALEAEVTNDGPVIYTLTLNQPLNLV